MTNNVKKHLIAKMHNVPIEEIKCSKCKWFNEKTVFCDFWETSEEDGEGCCGMWSDTERQQRIFEMMEGSSIEEAFEDEGTDDFVSGRDN